jgi:hypothetical protein
VTVHITSQASAASLIAEATRAASAAYGWRVVGGDRLQPWLGMRDPIRGVIADGIGMIFGDSGAGKTLVAIDMAIHLLTGMPWGGNPTDRLPVLYFATEGERSVERRFIARACSLGVPLSSDSFRFIGGALDLRNPGHVDALIAMARSMAPRGVAFIDTLANAAGGADENSASDMTAVLASAARLHAEAGWIPIFLHHTAKGGSTYRGSTAIRGRVDFSLEVAGSGMRRFINQNKQRDSEVAQLCTFEIHTLALGRDGYGEELRVPLAKVHSQGTPSTAAASSRRPKGEARAQALADLLRREVAGAPGSLVPIQKVRGAYEKALRAIEPGIGNDTAKKARQNAEARLVEDGFMTRSGNDWLVTGAAWGSGKSGNQAGNLTDFPSDSGAGSREEKCPPLGDASSLPASPADSGGWCFEQLSLRSVRMPVH